AEQIAAVGGLQIEADRCALRLCARVGRHGLMIAPRVDHARTSRLGHARLRHVCTSVIPGERGRSHLKTVAIRNSPLKAASRRDNAGTTDHKPKQARPTVRNQKPPPLTIPPSAKNPLPKKPSTPVPTER